MFDPSRKLNELSPVLYANGSYFIVQIMNIDPARTVDANTLKALQSNALVDWLQDQGGNGFPLPGQNITKPDSNMLLNTDNLPPNNMLPASAPAVTGTSTPSASGN